MKKVVGRLCIVAVSCLVAIPTQAEETNIFGIAMIDIPAGSFLMGSCQLNDKATEANKKRTFLGLEPTKTNCTNNDTEKPQHRVYIQAFQMGKTEVTLGQFKAFVIAAKREDLLSDFFMKDNRHGDDVPVMVNKDDAQKFIDWLNKIDGGGWRLPTEAEWEYACRAGEDHAYCGSDDLDEVAWHRENSDNRPQPVGKKKPNSFGLYDMSGNAWEWVHDCWHENYRGVPKNGTAWVHSCMNEGGVIRGIVRGGSWNFYPYNGDFPATKRTPLSSNSWVGSQFSGFRVVRPRSKH
jgi:formylglycine-generating enzyme required for sulfatase activity